MSELVRLFRDKADLYRCSREKVWKTLTERERNMVLEVEEDQALLSQFNELLWDYRKSKNFVVPKGLSPFEEEALKTMFRFVEELSYEIADNFQYAVFADELSRNRRERQLKASAN